MGQTKDGKYPCIKCDFTSDSQDDFGRFDEDMEMGVCVNCEPKEVTPHEVIEEAEVVEEKVKKPSHNHIQRVRRMGSPEQNRKLDEQIAAWERQNPTPERKPVQKKPEAKQVPKVNELQKSINYLTNKMNQPIYRPEAITYDSVKHIFWQYYRQVVHRETNMWIEAEHMEPATVEFMKNYLHWLLGSEEGSFDPRKSMYIWGQLGIGKSTIAEVGHLFMSYLKARTKWSSRYYKFVSMDELFLETYTTSSLDSIGKLANGSWCLDELRERHLTYKHYGNEFYMLSDILTARHNLWKRSGLNTIITSNIPPKRLAEVLQDDRLMDRIKQQYETFELVGTNKRHITKST